MDMAALPYRPGVGIMLLNAANQVFVAKRIDTVSEAWQMPQGGIDETEPPLQAALRELEEETGIPSEHVSVLAESRDWVTYDLPEHLIPKLWKGQFRGQKQKWFALRLHAPDNVINIHTEHPEFNEWKWIDMPRLPDMIVPFKRELYQQLVEEFKHLVMR